MADLVHGGYPLHYNLGKLLGGTTNASQSDTAPRSNLEFHGVAAVADTAAALVTAKMTVVPIPVEVGDEITAVTILVGNTAASSPTHSWAAIYSGISSPAIIGGQSTDGGTAAIASLTAFKFTLATAAYITSANAPYGYVWAAVSVTASSSVPSLLTVGGTIATVAQYAWTDRKSVV